MCHTYCLDITELDKRQLTYFTINTHRQLNLKNGHMLMNNITTIDTHNVYRQVS